MTILDSLAASNQNDSNFLHVHGVSQYRNNQADNAIESLTRAVELSPSDAVFVADLTAVKKSILDVGAAEVAAATAEN